MKRTIVIILLITMLFMTACRPSSEEKIETALTFIGKPTADLLDAIGQPNKISYSSSCLGDGQDGELYYDTFTVYVYRDTDGTETVYDVISLSEN